MIFTHKKPIKILSVKKIWDSAAHNALTDLAYFNGKWYCIFRESDANKGDDGVVRIITSEDGEEWTPSYEFSVKGLDLRDPKLCLTADKRMMALFGGSYWSNEKSHSLYEPRVAFSDDGKEWSTLHQTNLTNEWLWKVIWDHGLCYGVTYSFHDSEDKSSQAKLYVSHNGLDFRLITPFMVKGSPSEASIQFTDDGQMIVLVRRDGANKHALIGRSVAPFIDWEWNDSGRCLESPNFLILPNHTCWAAGRIYLSTPYGSYPKVALGKMNSHQFKPLIVFPSAGDCGYPGLVEANNVLWMSYYSTHEGKSSIYLTKIALDPN